MPRAILSYYDADGRVETFDSEQSSLTIGSSPECDVGIDGLREVACEIYLAEDGFYAEDKGGQLVINGRPGSGYLRDNDTLTLGGWMALRFGVDDDSGKAAPPAVSSPVGRTPGNPMLPGGRRHTAGTALALGVILPGGGQAYNGQPFKGAFVLLTTALVVPWIWSLFDARSTAARLAAAGGRTGRGGPMWFVLHGWFVINVVLTALVVLTLTGVLR